jgi:DNA mismatch repair protein PMS2
MSKALNDVYRSYNVAQQFPMTVLNLQLPTASYDVNVTPDKRKVFLHSEKQLLTELKDALTQVYEPSRNTFSVSKLLTSKRKDPFSGPSKPAAENTQEGDFTPVGGDEETDGGSTQEEAGATTQEVVRTQ